MIKMTTGALRSIFVAMSVAAAAVPRRGYPRRPLDLDRLELPWRLRGTCIAALPAMVVSIPREATHERPDIRASAPRSSDLRGCGLLGRSMSRA